MWIEWLNNIKTGAISFWESIDVSKVVDLFVYDGQNPLMFNTGLFLFLFVGFVWIYRLLARRDTLRIYFVILFSLYFYYKSSGLCFLLLLFVALSDYSLGRLLGWVSWKWMRRFFVLMSMAVNLGMLCYFKYTNLLLGTIADFTRAVGYCVAHRYLFFHFPFVELYYRCVSAANVPGDEFERLCFLPLVFPSVGGGSRSSGERLCPSDTPSVGDYTYAVGRRSFSRHVRVD